MQPQRSKKPAPEASAKPVLAAQIGIVAYYLGSSVEILFTSFDPGVVHEVEKILTKVYPSGIKVFWSDVWMESPSQKEIGSM